MTDTTLEKLRRTLTAQGIGLDAPVSETLDPQALRLRMAAAEARVRGATTSAADEEAVAHAVAPPELLDPDFALAGELGRGGMAVVWLAEQLPLARDVAIKCACDPGDPEASLLLLREAMITGQLEHPNIVPVHALVGTEHGPAVVLKRLSGCTWDALIRREEGSLERDLEIFAQVLNAVAFAHSRGVIHRDIKPANVMIGDYGEVYLLDWGVARRMDDPPSDAIVGTPRYMAPEMAEGLADARTDVFLLGATLHEVLTGETRHRGESALEVLYAAMHVEPYAYGPEVPEELAAICNRACARDPEARFPDVESLREAIAVFREHRAASTLSDAADDELRALCAAIARPDASYGAVQELFTRARLGFEAALRVWSESPAAREGLHATVCAMLDYEVAAGRPEAALALLVALPSPEPAREAKVRALIAERTRAAERARAMERDRDPRVGAPDRRRAHRAISVGVLGLTLTALVRRLFVQGAEPSPGHLTIVGGVVFTMVAAVIAWWRTHGPFNFLNRRIAEICLSTLAVSFASRLSGYLLHTPSAQILVSDALLLGLGGAALSAYHRAGPWLTVLAVLVAIVGSIWPSAVDELFIGLSVIIPVLALRLGRVERPGGDPRSFAQERGPNSA